VETEGRYILGWARDDDDDDGRDANANVSGCSEKYSHRHPVSRLA